MQEDIKAILTSFFEQSATNDLTAKHFPIFYSGLKLKVGFGRGNVAKISWIAFLGKEQRPQEGIFPVYYFFKEHHKLVLAYGISETKKPKTNWSITDGTQTITQYFKALGIKPYKYGLSYVYKVYDTYNEMEWVRMERDLDNLLEKYKQTLDTK